MIPRLRRIFSVAGACVERHTFDVVFVAVVAFTLGAVIAHWGFGVALPLLAGTGRAR